MRIVRNLMFAVFVLFHFNAVAMVKPDDERVYLYKPDTIANPEELESARDFCKTNKRMIVMTVDDSNIARCSLRTCFVNEGYVIFEFTNGNDFLDALRCKRFAKTLVPNSRIAICDNQMPGTNGEDVLEIIESEKLLVYAGENGERQVPAPLHTSDEPDMIKKKPKFLVRKMCIRELFKIMNDCNSPPTRPRAQTL